MVLQPLRFSGPRHDRFWPRCTSPSFPKSTSWDSLNRFFGKGLKCCPFLDDETVFLLRNPKIGLLKFRFIRFYRYVGVFKVETMTKHIEFRAGFSKIWSLKGPKTQQASSFFRSREHRGSIRESASNKLGYEMMLHLQFLDMFGTLTNPQQFDT